MKQTAVEWLQEILRDSSKEVFDGNIWEQAKAMEKEQMDKACEDWWNEGASYMYDGKRKYESFEQYYNETFKSVKHNTDIRSMDKLIESNKKFDENNLKGFKYDPNDRSEDTPDITNFFY